MTLLILASRSPRRQELLAEAGYSFIVLPPRSADESPRRADETPAQFVMRLAEEKAADVAATIATDPTIVQSSGAATPDAAECRSLVTPVSRFPSPDFLILACDTVAHCDGQILGKPDSADHARKMLFMLSGQEHEVLTGVCLVRLSDGRQSIRVAETRMRMDRLPDVTIAEYIASGLWHGKAGGFGFQDRLGWVHVTAGSPSNVVGLPLELLGEMLGEMSRNGP